MKRATDACVLASNNASPAQRGPRRDAQPTHATPVGTWSTWSAVGSLTSRAGELRSAPSGPDDRDRVAGKRALAPGVRVRRERAIK